MHADESSVIHVVLLWLNEPGNVEYRQESAPNYKARIEEAGFLWPPLKCIDYPPKTW